MSDAADAIALRAYLQRAEGRLAVMHTVAAALIGGSALIAFTPAFFREVVVSLASQIFELVLTAPPSFPLQIIGGLFLLLLAGMLVCLFLCLASLIRQLVRLYFIPPQNRTKNSIDLVRFSLPPIAFSIDEGPIVPGNEVSGLKKEILTGFFRHDYHVELIASYLGSRRIAAHDSFVRKNFANSLNQRREAFIDDTFSGPADGQTLANARLVNSLSSLTGIRDRSLVEEAARMEALLTRFHLQLRIVVFRYFQALLFFMITWGVVTALAIMFQLLQLQDLPPELQAALLADPSSIAPEAQNAFETAQKALEVHREQNQLKMTRRYLISFALIHLWAVALPMVTRLPFTWILAGRQRSDLGSDGMFDDRFIRHQRIFLRGSLIFSSVSFGATLLINILSPELSGLDGGYLEKYSIVFVGGGIVLLASHWLLAIKYHFDAIRP